MSIDRTDYVVVGAEVTEAYQKWYDEQEEAAEPGDYKYEDFLRNPWPDQPCYVIDVNPMMEAKYVAGIPLVEPGDIYGGMEYSEVEFDSLDLHKTTHNVRLFCYEHFGILVEPKLISFTQWS